MEVWKRVPWAGFMKVYRSWLFALCRYLPTFTFSDVFPVPNTSYAAPMRGVMSLKPFTPSVRENMMG